VRLLWEVSFVFAISSASLLCPRCGIGVEGADRFCRGCGAPLGAAASGHELRKTVSVVFCDLVGSTALGERLDPEALRHVLGRYYAEMRMVLERHGGLVEKFIGDAVVAVFGVPLVHEDDALRAVRAALEMRAALDGLNDELERESGVRVGVRIGVNTGEVVAGDLGPGASFASGDAVNVAARLEQAAADGEILVGLLTRQLLAEAVEVEQVEPLELHGKSEPVEAFRLLSVAADAEAVVRHFETPFVGRERELVVLAEEFEEAVTQPGCRLLTVLGEPGIGKTRLLREFARSIAGRARVLRGGCLPYGEGITYWPLREIIHDLSGGGDPSAGLASYLAGVERGDQIAGPILGAIGASDSSGSVEEVHWAARRLFEALAAERPLVVVLEDLHWAESTFLQLVEYLSDCATGAPILLLAAAREELLDTSPAWALPHPHSRLLTLEPLPDPEAGRLVDALTSSNPAPGQMRARLVDTGGGNPLFLEQLVALQAEDSQPESALPLPATITALLAARLDRLAAAERDVLERAAVEGVSFHRGPLTALLADQTTDVDGLLLDAVRRNLIRACQSSFPGDDGYRFVHALIRDAVYQSMPKELRAHLHGQFADWLQHTPAVRSGEIEEILGYHLEQAAHAKRELGHPDPVLAERASDKLSAAGRRALWRDDRRTAASLLERALALTRPSRLDVHLELDLADAVGWLDPLRAVALADAAAQRAHDAGDEPGQALARVVAAHYGCATGEVEVDQLDTLAHAALPLLEQADDHAGLVHVWYALAYIVANAHCRYEDMAEAAEQQLRHARLAGQRGEQNILDIFVLALMAGPRPAGEALQTIDERLPEHSSPRTLLRRARLLAMLDRFDEARQRATEASTQAREFGLLDPDDTLAAIATLAGDHETAARRLRQVCNRLEEQGNRGYLAYYAGQLGCELCALGRYDEAEPLARKGCELGLSEDAMVQMFWRQAQALVHAHRGQHTEAERLARKAVEIGEHTDALNWQGDALTDLAQVLEAAGRSAEAAEVLEQALDCYQRKQNIPQTRRTRQHLAALQSTHQ
jgi:class 3 adenylate cyclase/tetratricopeptide (TPR) repeat protein